MNRRRIGTVIVALVVLVGGGLIARNNLFEKKRRKPVDGAEPPATTCLASSWPRTSSRVSLEPAFDPLRFNRATGLYQSPVDPDRWYVLEKEGLVWTFRRGDTAASLYIDLREYGVRAIENEVGLLGMAFHPDFAENGRVFFSYTTHGVPLESHVAEYYGTRDGMVALGPPREILDPIPQFFKNHKGGDIKFGPKDGYLYISLGDGKTPGDELQNGQDTYSLSGKLLRIDVDPPEPYEYRIPPDNPFAQEGGRGEVFAYGFRNMWRFGFDSLTGDIWGGDVGQHDWEELDLVVKGGNYGWHHKQGKHCFAAKEPCDDPEWIDPVAEHPHTEAVAIVAGFPYRGRAMPELWGATIYGDHGTGRIWAVRKGEKPAVLVAAGPAISSFAEDLDGEIYAVGYGEQRYVWAATQGGRMFKLVPSEDVGTGSAPVSLSRTGCVEPENPTVAAASLIPYDVNSPLWSDGAAKRRWVSLPPGKTITVQEDGDWDLPTGTVLMKEFVVGGKRVETRLFVHHEDGEWSGFSYEWGPEEKDATLVPDGKVVTVGAQTWTIPSRSQCMECHTGAAGRSLGLENAQLNRDFAPGSGFRGNQIEYFRDNDLFTEDPGKARSLAAAAPPESSAPVAERARAYLAANCSHCHRPGGTAQAEMDLRNGIPLAQMNVCDVEPTQGDLGVAGAKLVAPGNAKGSVLALRPTRLDESRMPPLATSVVDEQGAGLIASWIDTLKSCN